MPQGDGVYHQGDTFQTLPSCDTRESWSKWKKGNYDPEWICNIGMTHGYSLFLFWRVRFWAHKTNAKAQIFSVYELILKNQAILEICDIFGKLFSRQKNNVAYRLLT